MSFEDSCRTSNSRGRSRAHSRSQYARRGAPPLNGTVRPRRAPPLVTQHFDIPTMSASKNVEQREIMSAASPITNLAPTSMKSGGNRVKFVY